MSQKLDRRRFLFGVGGAVLALPMLEAFTPRELRAGTNTPPKRVVFMMHPHGRPLDDTDGPDIWSPRTTTGALPTNLSTALAALAPIRDKIVTIDGIDNIVRHATGDDGGHGSAGTTCLTCANPIVNGSDNETATGPSIDFVLGQRLKASGSMKESVVFPAQLAGETYQGYSFYGEGGSPPYLADSRPEKVITDLFASVQNPMMPPPTPTLHDKLVGRRKSILDGVAKSFTALRGKLNEADRDRLDQHAAFIQNLEQSVDTGTSAPTMSCTVPNVASIPNYSGENGRGQKDAITTPFQIENVVQALACDVTRVASLHFHANYDPLFPSVFPNGNQSLLSSNWHALIHENGAPTDPDAGTIKSAFSYFANTYTSLVQRLGQMIDLDGSTMLDNTLVVWVSDMGFGAVHYDYNVPVVMAGMPSAFPQGQGRHVVMNQHTLGDLYAQILRMVGGTDTTFGATGTLGDISSHLSTFSGKNITASTPLNRGPIDL
jgi:Protein of unknown function (DUF1552)